MRIQANDVHQGRVIIYNDKPHRVFTSRHTKPGKGPAYMQVELISLIDGTKHKLRLRTNETVDTADMRQHKSTFMYDDENACYFMDQENFETVAMPKKYITFNVNILQPDNEYTLEYYNGSPISVTLPKNLTLKVIEVEHYQKGQTATKTYKTAIVDGNIQIRVPIHISLGDMLIIDSESLDYVRKA